MCENWHAVSKIYMEKQKADKTQDKLEEKES